MLGAVRKNLSRRSAAVLGSIEGRLDRIMQIWLLLAGLACAARIAARPIDTYVEVGTLVPYLLLIFAPFASMVLALRWFANSDRMPQPSIRLAQLGRWESVDLSTAKAGPLYGPGGIMVSLLVGILINVPVRATEYLAAIPALAGTVPAWFETLHLLMTLDVVVFTSLYTIAFVAALRCAPVFPRLLLAIWVGDIAMQLTIAEIIAGIAGLPSQVAGGLHTLLDANVKKVLISVGLWLPYLLLSRRVNLTYRHRLPA
jgi:hypothetical protein